MFKLNIRNKLILAFGCSFIVILILGNIITYGVLRNAVLGIAKNEIKNIAKNVTETTITAIDASIKNYLRAVSEKSMGYITDYYNLYQHNGISLAGAKAEIRKLILSPEYGKIGKTGYLSIVSGKGILLIHPKSEGADASKMDFMQKALQQKNGYLEYMWANKGEEEKREKVGWLAYFEPWDWLVWASSYKEEFNNLIDIDTFKDKITSMKVGDRGYVYIIDSKGNIVIHSKFKTGENLYQNDFIQKICKEKSGETTYLWKNPDEKKASRKIAYYEYIKSMDWIVVATTYESDIYKHLGALSLTMFLVVLLSLLLIIPVIFLISKSFVNPIHKLIGAFNNAEKGDMQTRIEMKTGDEFETLAFNFNKFMASFLEIINEMGHVIKTQLASVQHLSSSSREISTTANQQSASVSEIVSTMENNKELSMQIAGKTEEVAELADKTNISSEKGVELRAENMENMEEIKGKNSTIINEIKDLGNKITRINEIITIIDGIADQTKLIAFNASLEAASAGESGNRFGVVASEIRRFADNVVFSTKENKNKIEEIQGASNNLV